MNHAVLTLFNEIFEGTPPGASGTYFVQGDEALFATLSNLSAEEASHRINPTINSIVAHVVHMTYYIHLSNEAARGGSGEGDWEQSWTVQSANETEWESLREALNRECATLKEAMSNPSTFEHPRAMLGAVANIGHAAYHLGAIRQLYLVVKSR